MPALTTLGKIVALAGNLWALTMGEASATALKTIPWSQCLRQKPEWYSTAEAKRIADNLLLYQFDNGGWPKNEDMARILSDAQRQELLKKKSELKEATIDNGATYTQLRYLAKVFRAGGEPRFKDGFLRGLDFLLSVQYENGGWPQFPYKKGYYQHVTFNDNAMVGVLELLRELTRAGADFAFVDRERRARAAQAVAKGVDCILKCQVVVNGRRTAWCAQHDEKTLQPAPARSYELASLSGAESVGIVRFLMGLEHPEPQVIDAIESAVAWFQRSKINGIRLERKADPTLPRGFDTVVVNDPKAEPLWARFYEIDTNRPFFCGRDGVKRYALAEIELERRTGYAWYTPQPKALLNKDYPEWKSRLGARSTHQAR